MELKEDFLEADREIRGQNYVCLSFISPEKTLKNKNMFYMHSFLKSISPEYNLDETQTEDKFNDFLFKNKDTIDKQFSEANQFRTTVRGLKVRGTYDTLQEAEIRAKRLQKTDPNFNVFVGQVGYWLPWDPESKEIGDERFLNDELNTLMSKYKENAETRDEVFNNRKRDLIQKNNLEVSSKKASLEELEKNSDTFNEVSDTLSQEDPWLSRKNTKE